MSVSNLSNIRASWLFNSTNYVNDALIDASKYANDLPIKQGTPVWSTYDGVESADLDNNFWFETYTQSWLPKCSIVMAVHYETIPGGDGILQIGNLFIGGPATDDHIADNYDPSIDVFSPNIRDKQIQVVSGQFRVFDSQGANASLPVPSGGWSIFTINMNGFPESMSVSLNGGTPVDIVNSNLVNVGNYLRIGNLKDTGGITSGHIAVGEMHVFSGDVSQDINYQSVIDVLKVKYSIT